MARALYQRGATFRNALLFMVASTNLVVELGVVIASLLGWRFVVAQVIGGIVMLLLLAIGAPLIFTKTTLPDVDSSEDVRDTSTMKANRRDQITMAARYALGDLRMIRVELFIGFIVAGYLSAHVANHWWTLAFFSGHGVLTVVENALLAPGLAVISFVCSVGNIPFALTLWRHGISFAGVISFIFADLITLPLLVIYRRFYGGLAARRMLGLLWFCMSAAGLIVEAMYRGLHLLPSPRTSLPDRHLTTFPLGVTLALNLTASLLLVGIWLISRRSLISVALAQDPVCGMSVDPRQPAAMLDSHGQRYFFCSPRCADEFAHRGASTMVEQSDGDATDPICGMRVASATALSAIGPTGETYYFCADSCRRTFLEGGGPPTVSIKLGRKNQ
jgi:uncharacterized protein